MSQSGCIGFAFIRACLEAVSGNLRILPLETALKGDLNEMSTNSQVENFLQRRCKRPPLARLSLERSGAGDGGAVGETGSQLTSQHYIKTYLTKFKVLMIDI